MTLLGLDIGGTNLKAVSLSPEGRVLASVTVPAGGAIPRETLLARVADTVRGIAGAVPARIGIAVGGALQPDGTMRLGSTNLPNLADLPLVETFSALLGAPCRFEHDGRAAMRGEGWVGAARGAANAMTLTFGTGIGAGLLLGGRIHPGAHLGAGEIGVWRLAPPPETGDWLSVEDIAAPGGFAFRRRGLDYATLVAAPASDADRAGLFGLVGRTIANAHTLLDLEVVVLVGGVTALGEPFRAAVAAAFEAACPAGFAHGLAIRLGELGPYCGAIGAAALWRDELPA
ncbi:MAG: ROK family protein [Bauldia sp.]|nr:ROK family protein [Bauldia sp.]